MGFLIADFQKSCHFFGWHLPPHLFSDLHSKQAAPGLPCNSSWRRIAYAINRGELFTPFQIPNAFKGAGVCITPPTAGFPVGPWRENFRAFLNF
jgi:hypothetical protein